jgi:hypothetical protein
MYQKKDNELQLYTDGTYPCVELLPGRSFR